MTSISPFQLLSFFESVKATTEPTTTTTHAAAPTHFNFRIPQIPQILSQTVQTVGISYEFISEAKGLY